MPLINYALCYLKHHIDSCYQTANILHSVSQFVDELTDNPAAYFLESWVGSHLNKTVPTYEQGVTAKNFRNRILHTAVRIGFSRVADVLLIVGAQVKACLNGKTPLIVSAESGHVAVAQLLIEKGANVYANDDYNRYTALH
jgi:hypothetical protein